MDKVTTGRTRTTQHGWAVDDLGREYVPAEVADKLLDALQNITAIAADELGPNRPCVRWALDAIKQATQQGEK